MSISVGGRSSQSHNRRNKARQTTAKKHGKYAANKVKITRVILNKKAKKPIRFQLSKLGSKSKTKHVFESDISVNDGWLDEHYTTFDEGTQTALLPQLCSTSQTLNNTIPLTFLDLPQEIRDIIYTHTMSDLPTRFPHTNTMKPDSYALYPMTLPSICFTSKAVWTEAVLAYIRRTRFIIVDLYQWVRERDCNSHGKLATFLARFPDKKGFSAVQMLGFRGFRGYYHMAEAIWGVPQPDHLVRQCPGLRSLVLELNWEFVVGVSRQLRKSKAGVGQAFEETLQGRALFEVRSLRHLVILLDDPHLADTHRVLLGPGLTLDDWTRGIYAFLENGFKEHGRSIKIEILSSA
ncbi:hypothetical protein K491DRAFT_683441 [Lophiostoma macrostomum CBS 122681]|uniref:Uncharacterized protein n=1 Tax=Lophiostoma macrostomum CBS 122681 TaxID=1314788 RepID=A0A6A6SQU5_9PLEO|nr:hypothetical protein K491DRAFT_683441 [Lophiostoma macrostomum CBS 122681]